MGSEPLLAVLRSKLDLSKFLYEVLYIQGYDSYETLLTLKYPETIERITYYVRRFPTYYDHLHEYHRGPISTFNFKPGHKRLFSAIADYIKQQQQNNRRFLIKG